MISYINDGDIFKSTMSTLMCPVNQVGVMGNGLALAFRKKWPTMFEAYREACYSKEIVDEGYFFYENPKGHDVYCFVTKTHFNEDSSIQLVTDGLYRFMNNYQDLGIESIAIPALGCGQGHLDWAAVEHIISGILPNITIPVEVYRPTR